MSFAYCPLCDGTMFHEGTTCRGCDKRYNVERAAARQRALLDCARAARRLVHIPALLQALGAHHTKGCDCPLCATQDALRRLGEQA